MENTADTQALHNLLDHIGLQQYFQVLLDNGFDDWPTVLDITEADLAAMGFKLGHRRTLQREIATFRGHSRTIALPIEWGVDVERIPPSRTDSTNSVTSNSPAETPATDPTQQPPATSGQKRKYRRHPKPDENAPRRPKTAYAKFADHLRTIPEIASMSFVEIAKEVGRQWQAMAPEQKLVWETESANEARQYDKAIEEYCRTPEYQTYQEYLEAFKEKQRRRKDGSGSQSSSTRVPSEERSPFSQVLKELANLKKEYGYVKPYDSQHLPPRHLAQHAITAFCDGIGSFLFIFQRNDALAILQSVYDTSRVPDALTLSELFAITAVGSSYDGSLIPEDVRQRLFASCALSLDTIPEAEHFRLIRILLCLSQLFLLKKHSSAKRFVAAALEMARLRMPKMAAEAELGAENEGLRRIHGTAMFLDCWLAISMGFKADTSLSEIQQAIPNSGLLSASTSDNIYDQVTSIGLVALEIFSVLSSPDGISPPIIQELGRKLDTWHDSLPQELLLNRLMARDSPAMEISQSRAIPIVHMLYLGNVISLYREPLIAAENARYGWEGAKLGFSEHELDNYRDRALFAAQQMTHVLDLLRFNENFVKRSWMIIHSVLTAALILLFGGAQNLRRNRDISHELSCAASCIKKLHICAGTEGLAARYLKLLAPLQEGLERENERTKFGSQQGVNDTARTNNEYMDREEITRRLALLLRDLFVGGKRSDRVGGNPRGGTADPSAMD